MGFFPLSVSFQQLGPLLPCFQKLLGFFLQLTCFTPAIFRSGFVCDAPRKELKTRENKHEKNFFLASNQRNRTLTSPFLSAFFLPSFLSFLTLYLFFLCVFLPLSLPLLLLIWEHIMLNLMRQMLSNTVSGVAPQPYL